MGEDKAKESAQAKPKYCVECNGTLSHQGAYFCKLCAADFYGADEMKEGKGE